MRPTRYNRPVELWGAGTDCVGFAQQAATYRGHPYRWVSLGRRDLEPIAETEPVYRAFPRIETDPGGDGKTYSDAIVTREEFDDLPRSEYSTVLGRIRPGDIMYYAPGHIAIVRQVVTNEEGVVDDLSDVLLIESVYDSPTVTTRFANVTSTRNLQRMQTDEKNWRIVRLRVEE